MLIQKYNYQSLKKETIEGKRNYCLPDGSKVASVTTILDKTKSEESKAALAAWRRRVGDQQAQAITTEAAGRGTRMHKFLEDFCLTREIREPGTNPYSRQSHAMAKTIISQGLKNVNEIWGLEVPLYYPGLYAGTTDCCGIHIGTESIIDYKQTNKPKKVEWINDYFLQMCAYALAHNEIYKTNIRKGVIMMCVAPTLNESLEMVGDADYQEFVIEGSDFDKYSNLWWDRVELYYSQNR